MDAMAVNRVDRSSLAAFARRSPTFSIAILVIDLAIYCAFLYGVLAAEPVWLKLLFAFGAGTMISVAAIVAHDAGHRSFSGSKRLNRLCGTIALLPACTPFSLWEHYHNQVHHRFTAQIGLDNAFPPMTVEQYRNASPASRAYYRFLRSLLGATVLLSLRDRHSADAPAVHAEEVGDDAAGVVRPDPGLCVPRRPAVGVHQPVTEPER
jgi:omega-6 fatty acid desaturase (delta-12 desaturase)